MPEREDLELVTAAAKGDIESFTLLAKRYYPAMVAIGHSILGSKDTAEDAAQQTFAKAVRYLPQLKNKEKFAGWLAAICRNQAIDLAEKNNKFRSTGDISMIADEPNQESEAVQLAKEAIENLSASAKEIIFLRYHDGLTYDEISKVLGISNQAINGRVRRAKKKIAGYLERNGIRQVGS